MANLNKEFNVKNGLAVNGTVVIDSTGSVAAGSMPSGVSSHISDTSNPHSVTPSQIGAAALSGINYFNDKQQIDLTANDKWGIVMASNEANYSGFYFHSSNDAQLVVRNANGTASRFGAGEYTVEGNEIWHAGNLTPSNYSTKSTVVNATLSAASWTGASAPFSYSLTVSGVTAISNQELVPTTDATDAQIKALQGANITDAGQSTNTISLKAWGTKPTIDLPIRVILRGD